MDEDEEEVNRETNPCLSARLEMCFPLSKVYVSVFVCVCLCYVGAPNNDSPQPCLIAWFTLSIFVSPKTQRKKASQ